MFGTRLPRPTGVGRHLFVVVLVSVVALAVAILFAERNTEGEATEKAKPRFTRPQK